MWQVEGGVKGVERVFMCCHWLAGLQWRPPQSNTHTHTQVRETLTRNVTFTTPGMPPFGSRGTVTAVMPTAVEVLLDEPYAGELR